MHVFIMHGIKIDTLLGAVAATLGEGSQGLPKLHTITPPTDSWQSLGELNFTKQLYNRSWK